MQNNFENELRGVEDDAIAAQHQIGKYFKRYGESGHQDAFKHQLIFASRIINSIAKCEVKYPKIYCEIITQVFGDNLKPECSDKYWSAYVNNLRYFHYHLVTKKHFEYASKIYYYICDLPPSKLQTEDVCLAFVSMYCNQMFLQNVHLQNNRKPDLTELNHIVENLQVLFEQMLDKNKEINLQYKDVLHKCLQSIFPSSGYTKMQKLFSHLTAGKVARMFASLFKLHTQQRMSPPPPKEEIQQMAHFIIETLNNFIVYDIMDNFQTQLCVQLLKYCHADSNLQSDKAIAELFGQLYQYLKIICMQKPIDGFQSAITKCCEGFRQLFELHSKNAVNYLWFKDMLVLISTIHIQIQNTTVFCCFWKQMKHLSSYRALLMLLLEAMKLAPCISSDSKLNTIRCCTSFRKHIILTFANAALSIFVLYCQNVKDEPKEECTNGLEVSDGQENSKQQDVYVEELQKPLLLIVSHAFKIIDKMECIDSKSQDIAFLLTRFKQAAVSASSARQAKTCVKLAELYLKINNKFAETEWPLLLRRIYKSSVQCFSGDPQQIREMQICYIASLLHLNTEIDFTQIRGQISMYYSDSFKDEQQQKNIQNVSIPPHENCLLYSLMRSTNPLRPHLRACRKKLLHWLEVQHTVKYYRTNINLMQSLISSSQSYYDFVITTRCTKLLTSQVPKFLSIHKHLRTKSTMSRLEQLTYGHTCTKLLQEYHNQRSQAMPLETKDFGETQLEQLLLNKEMEKMTICNELQYVKLAYDGYSAFQEFYDRFDTEKISSEEALIDWEAIVDDLTTLAQYLQFGNYMEYASNVWLLHYKICQLLWNSCSSLISLTFFCEFSVFHEKTENGILQLEKEVQWHLPNITQALEQLSSLTRRKQNVVFLATLQIAYYYANNGKYSFAQMLLQFVEEKHGELGERQGCYDIVRATLDVIRYRLLWKHYCRPEMPKKAASLLLNQCLMDEMERMLDRLRDFSFVSGDALYYNMLITNLAQDMAECSANRMYENFLNSLFVVACRCAVQYGYALRMAQVMCSWMWINLQMEYVDQAQVKMKIIEYVMGIKSLKELIGNSVEAKKDEEKCSSAGSPENYNDILSSLNHHNDIEAARRLAHVQLSPIKTGKLYLRPDSQITTLKSYFKFKIDTKTLPQNEFMDWTYFVIGCLNARLYFLVEDYVQLQPFYEKGREWLEMRQNRFNKNFFKHIQLMAMQHYVNFLRANNQHDKAIECLQHGLEVCETIKWSVDAVYRVNFKQQLLAAHHEMPKNALENMKNMNKLKKINISPDKVVRCSNKKAPGVVNSSNRKQVTGNTGAAISTRKPSNSQTNSSSSSSPELKIKAKTKPKFNICEDAIEILDSDDDNMHNNMKDKKKITKVTKTYARKIPSSSAAKVTKSKTSPMLDSIELIDPPAILSTAMTSSTDASSLSSTSSSMENLQAKENQQPHNNLDIITKLENLDLNDKTKEKRGRPRLRRSPTAKKTSIVILEDSPLSLKPITKAVVTKSRSRTRNQKNLLDAAIKSTTNETNLNVRSTRRRHGDVI